MRGSVALALSFSLSLLLTGCALNTTAVPDSSTGTQLQGLVHGGSAPVVGAHVHLMAASASGYGAAAGSLLTSNTAGTDSIGGYVLTGTGGSFTITGDYTCVSGTQVYVLATQGNPGLSGSQNNPNLALMSAIGQCPSAGNFAATVPFIIVNEVTTAASVYALSGFMTDLTHVGSSGTALALQGIANAFATVNNLIGVASGAALATTPAGNGTPPQAELNTVANIIASCVNTLGASSSNCITLFNNALNGSTHPTDTVTAALNIAHNPAANISTLFGLQAGVGSPYIPDLGTAPNDFTVAVTYTGGGINTPNSIAIDGLGNVWTANNNGSLSKINGVTGAAISSSSGYTGGGLYAPFSIAIDTSGNAWAVNPEDYNFLFNQLIAPASVSEFSSTGVPTSGSPYTAGGLSNANQYSPRDIAFDASGHAWIANTGGGVTELNTNGTAVSGSPFSLGSANQNPSGVAVDSANHLWVSGFTTSVLSEVSVTNGSVVSTTSSGANGLQEPYAVAIDSANNIWLPNNYDSNTLVGDTVSEFNASGGAVNVYSGGGLEDPAGVAIDGLGNVWVANELRGITELNNSGAALSPSTGYKGTATYSTIDVAVDGSGNVWVPNDTSSGLVEFVGAGAPTVTPIATAVTTSKLSTRP